MSRFINETEVKRNGAIELVSACRDFSFAQIALQRLQSGASPKTAGHELAAFFKEQAETIEKLERELQRCQLERDSLKKLLDHYWANPLHEQLKKTQNALDEQTQRAERAEKNESELRTTLERERRLNADAIAELQANVQEQQSIIAQQHLKLQELLGTDTQIHNDPL